MSGPVVVAGEALIDLVPQPGGALAPLLGGGPFNTARALGRLGQPAAFVGAVSRDAFGEQIAEALAADGVALDDGLRVEPPTSLAIPTLNPEGVATYRFYFEGTSAPALTPAAARAALPAAVAALHVGSLGLVLEPMAEALESLVGAVAGRAPVMVDPNVRPGLIADPHAYRARLDRIIARADILKVSDEDLAVLDPGRPARLAAKALLAKGPRLVLLTLGAEGAVVFGAFGARTAAAPRVEVADTIGAGDTFSGAWLARWLELGRPVGDPDQVLDATAFACRAAALSCTRAGAQPPTWAEVSAWRP